ncbi:MAG: rhodanese-like domain-containing protein [Gammaproteobacteria bacterium]|nr:rhodanese-like domain-containing protein [Gammaproteobacteria bacterium]NNJ49370.1 rhodanese-like domain-containing protein [Gammaproteobacteria bacterium]
MEQLSEFVLNNLLLFAALVVVLVMLIKAELEHQANKGSYLSPSMATRLINNHSDALILDVRTAADYKNGHIKGAKNIPLGDFAGSVDKLAADKDKPVLVYCNSGNTVTRAIKLLKKAGFQQVNNLDGGIAAWKEANMPLSKKK